MNKIEITNSIFKIVDMWHVTDYDPVEETEEGFLYTLQALINYDGDEIEGIIESLKEHYEDAIDNDWQNDENYKPAFELYDQVMIELYELLKEC